MTTKTVGELRQGASRVLQACNLKDVRLLSAKASSGNPVVPGPFAVESQMEVRGASSDNRDVFAFTRYTVDAVKDASPTTSVWSLEIELVASYACEIEQHFTDEDLFAFAIMIGATHIHPYARETVQSFVARMGYPPLTIDTLEPLSALPDDYELELDSGE